MNQLKYYTRLDKHSIIVCHITADELPTVK